MGTLRIISGVYGGRSIKAPSGERSRPTADRVREAWASTINSLISTGFEGLSVLDAFAGSGALGIEALSRGARSALFCDTDLAALSTIRTNLASLGIDIDTSQPKALSSGLVGAAVVPAKMLKMNILSAGALERLEGLGPFDAVFLDPPYREPRSRISTLISTLAQGSLLAQGCLISYESASAHTSPNIQSDTTHDDWGELTKCSLELVAKKAYGQTCIEYLIFRGCS